LSLDELTEEEKERLLKTLERDQKFRYAMMGLLGYKEVLERFARLEERQQKLEERQQRLEERQAKLERRQQKLEERFARLEERFARLEERQLKLEERQQKLEQEMIYLRRIMEYTRRDVGALTEAMYSRMAWEDIRDEARARGERVLFRRRNVRVNGYDIDLMIEAEKSIYVVEIKMQPNHQDVNELLEKSEAVERATGKKVIPVLAGTWIGREVKEYCRERNVIVLEY